MAKPLQLGSQKPQFKNEPRKIRLLHAVQKSALTDEPETQIATVPEQLVQPNIQHGDTSLQQKDFILKENKQVVTTEKKQPKY